jgi:sec-independent protein translocase protein TatB
VFGINGGEWIVLIVLALVLIGPERLPHYAEQLGRGARHLRGLLGMVRERAAQEGVEWEQLDPRRYDPRRIVSEALTEPTRPVPRRPRASRPAPFDDEAT